MTQTLKINPKEVWRTIPHFPLYEASSEGRVRRAVAGVNTSVGRILKTGTSPSHRYLTVGLMRDGRAHTTLVHAAVAAAFHGQRPEGFQVSHVDGDAHNNRPANVTYEPASENNRRKAAHGTQIRGADHPGARLTEAAVMSIREQASAGARHRDLAASFGCGKTTITRVAARKSWAHVQGAST